MIESIMAPDQSADPFKRTPSIGLQIAADDGRASFPFHGEYAYVAFTRNLKNWLALRKLYSMA
jgi:hypothetical protein